MYQPQDSEFSIGCRNKTFSSVFENCMALESVMIPGVVASIGNRAFTDCSSLIEVTIENGVKELSNRHLLIVRCLRKW